MASDAAAFYMIHPHRSKEAFAALIDDWAGILVSDGYGVYRHWVQALQTAWPISSAAPGSSSAGASRSGGLWDMGDRRVAASLSYGAALPRWSGGPGRPAVPLIDQYHDRQDDAGKFARRLLREMDSLWVFLAHVRRADEQPGGAGLAVWGALAQALLGTASDKGNRWVERILSLRETCRLQAKSTYTVPVGGP